jgi:hypothetical protein
VAGHKYNWFVRGYTGSGTSLKFTNSAFGPGITAPSATACTVGGKLTIKLTGQAPATATFHSAKNNIGNCGGLTTPFTITGSKLCQATQGQSIGDSSNATRIAANLPINVTPLKSWVVESHTAGAKLTPNADGSITVYVPVGETAVIDANYNAAHPSVTPSPTPTPDVPTCVQSTIAPATGAAPLTVTLFGGGAAGKTSLVTGYEWDFDNNGSWDTGVSIDPVKHTYGTPGTYTPKYRILGSNGKWSATCNYKYKIVALNPGAASLSLIIGLDTIGTTGDNTNPAYTARNGINTAMINGVAVTSTFGSNQNPKTIAPTLKLELINSAGKYVATPSVNLSYVDSSASANFGKFIGTIDLGTTFKTGDYIAKVTVNGHLTRTVAGIQTITAGHQKTLSARLVAGDVDNSNALNIFDYNIFISCMHNAGYNNPDNGALCAKNTNYAKRSDVNDNGVIDLTDRIYFIREWAVQTGD